MKNKIMNLFDGTRVVQNKGVKYSTLLEQFIEPFKNDFADIDYYEDIFEFATNAWNFGNIKLLFPEEESDATLNTIIDSTEGHDINTDLLIRMIDYKVSHFKEYTNFIADFEIKETSGGPVLTVMTQEQDTFLATMYGAMEEQDERNEQHDYDENYVNRTAIIIKPLQPFLDWCSHLYPNSLEEMKATKTFLISEDIEDVEAWLKKKFKKIYEFELETWHLNKKEWPQKRNYKIFKEWFQIDISTQVYDFEKKPVFKSE